MMYLNPALQKMKKIIFYFISRHYVKKSKFIHRRVEMIFFHFLCPAGLAILPNLLCYQWLEVCKYVSAIDASHLRQVSADSELANCRI